MPGGRLETCRFADPVGERAAVHYLVVSDEAGYHLCRQHKKERKNRETSERVVPGPLAGAAARQGFDITEQRARCVEKIGKAGVPPADEPPCEPEYQKATDRVARPEVPCLHERPEMTEKQAGRDRDDQCPMEQADAKIPFQRLFFLPH